MAGVTIYHNPRCTKSRQAMAVLDEAGVDANVVRYLDNPPDEATLRSIIDRLALDEPQALVRRDGWAEHGLDAAAIADTDGIVKVLLEHPQLLQRPLIDTGDRVVIGRPTERVAEAIGTA